MKEVILDSFLIQLDKKQNGYIANGETVQPDIRRVNDQLWHVIHQQKSYTLFIHKIDRENKEVDLSLNGKRTTIKIRSRMEKLLHELGMEDTLNQRVKEIKAPMPGLIHSIKVSVGEEVAKDAPLCILEAMKMENVIKSPGEGKVARIHVREKDSVDKNELLISFE